MTEIRRGRPRSESARLAVLEATRDLVAEAGYDAMTIESIAARAGVGRQTIYRWWSAKSAIVADAVLAGHIRLPEVNIAATGSLAADLKTWIDDMSAVLQDPAGRQLVRALVVAASEDARESELLYGHVTGPYHEALAARLELGKAAGQVAQHADPDAIADALIGTSLFHTLTRQHEPQRLARLVEALLPAPK